MHPQRRLRTPILRRAYFDCRYGQLHVHQAIPPGGGFDEQTALVCLPAPDADAGLFHPLLARLGGGRSVYALDPPGVGQSDAAPAGTASALADAAADLLRDLRIRNVHLLADGAAVGAVAALVAAMPERVRRIALCARPDGEAASFDRHGALLCVLPVPAARLSEDAPAAQAACAQLLEFLDAPEAA